MSSPSDDDTAETSLPGEEGGITDRPAVPPPAARQSEIPGTPVRADIDSSGTWSDPEPPSTRPTPWPPLRERDLEQQRHVNNLQSRLLLGIGGGIGVTLLIVVVGPWVGAISEDFAKTLAQMIIPALLGFIGAVVGTLFKDK